MRWREKDAEQIISESGRDEVALRARAARRASSYARGARVGVAEKFLYN